MASGSGEKVAQSLPAELEGVERGPDGKKQRLMEVAMPSDNGISTRIAELKAEQAAIQKQRKEVAKNLRNAERRKQRLKAKARQLTDEDLVAVLMLRRQQRTAKADDQNKEFQTPPKKTRPEEAVLSPSPASSAKSSGHCKLMDEQEHLKAADQHDEIADLALEPLPR